MRTFGDQDQATTATYGAAQVSGVREAPTAPAPYLEETPFDTLVGSVPMDSLSAYFQPITSLRSGRTLAFEAIARCTAPGLSDNEELFARATFEKKVGQLGRVIRGRALAECPGTAVFISVHPHELKDPWLIRPDDPLSSHDGEIYLQVNQPAYSATCMHVLQEVASRSGISVVLDDFGAGGSTLARLIDLRPRFVKVDAELVRGIAQDARKRRALAGLVQTCGELDAHVIAKGVDAEPDLAALCDCGVAYGQGRLLGLPTALPTVSKWPGLR